MRFVVTALLLLCAALMGCSEEAVTATVGAGGGGAGGSGGGDAGCPAGTRELSDGHCQPAGVPPAMCPPGFAAEDAGCSPLLPDGECAPGTIALPGDASCRPLSDCGSGTWGNIADDPTTQHVDPAYGGGQSDGSRADPWTTIGEAVLASAPGDTIAIAAGTYNQAVGIAAHPLIVRGRCAEMVELAGTSVGLVVGDQAQMNDVSGTEVHDIAITSDQIAVVISGATEVLLDGVWVHDAPEGGVLMGNNWGAVEVTIRNALFEDNGSVGVAMLDGMATIEGSIVRGGVPGPLGEGRGLTIESVSGMSGGPVTISDSVIVGNSELGIGVGGMDVIIERTVVSDTTEDTLGGYGRGINVQDVTSAGFVRSNAVVRQSAILRNHEIGVIVAGGDMLLEHTTVRDTYVRALDEAWGIGVMGQLSRESGETAQLTVRESAIDHSSDIGLAIISADGTVESLRVDGTLPDGAVVGRGMGISVSFDINNVVNAPAGTGLIRWSHVSDSHVVGIGTVGSLSTIERTLVAGTLPLADDAYGDGVLVMGGSGRAEIEVTDCRIEGSARAGIAGLDADVRLGGTTLECNAIHLNSETVLADAGFDALGGNVCGCDGVVEECKVLGSHLDPPAIDTGSAD